MADQPTITIVLRKPVANKTEAQTLVDAVKTKLADKPDISISAKYNESIEPTNP